MCRDPPPLGNKYPTCHYQETKGGWYGRLCTITLPLLPSQLWTKGKLLWTAQYHRSICKAQDRSHPRVAVGRTAPVRVTIPSDVMRGRRWTLVDLESGSLMCFVVYMESTRYGSSKARSISCATLDPLSQTRTTTCVGRRCTRDRIGNSVTVVEIARTESCRNTRFYTVAHHARAALAIGRAHARAALATQGAPRHSRRASPQGAPCRFQSSQRVRLSFQDHLRSRSHAHHRVH